ncbi:MAG: type I 3-dehydroquinate dehydratase [Planctomycetaceae bacterium]|nr:type I 3-dehydroquinate dehydratase [Planctomycetaceae bacterium]
MICITVTPTSRTLAKADLLNAARQGDLVELCLDHFHKEPDVKDLITAIDKPILVSCRRPEDGGKWKGTEEQRLMMLRQAIVAGPAYVELDLSIANQVPRFGSTQRVISFTRLDAPETDIDSVFDEAANAKADIVKFTWPTPTLDDAWPLLAAVSQKRTIPVVGIGLGQAELTFSLLGRKYGSPWIYAALEQGMEAYPGQSTVSRLDETYYWRDIDSKTGFVAIAGFGPAQLATTRILNAGFKEAGLNVRCLPIEIGDLKRLKKMLDVLRIRAVITGGGFGRRLVPLADHVDPHDARSQYLNLLLKRDDGWHGYNTLWRAGLRSLETEMGGEGGGKRPLERQNVLILGNGGMAESMVYAVAQRKGLVSVCGPGDKEAQQVAQQQECRFVSYHNLYETLTDALIVADPTVQLGTKHGQVNPSLLRSSMTVLDVSHLPHDSEFLKEARSRGCKTIDAAGVFKQQVISQFKAITGKELSEAALSQGMMEES